MEENKERLMAFELGKTKTDPTVRIIRITNERPDEYTYSMYKKGWVLQVLHEYDGYVTARVLTGNVNHMDTIISVHPLDHVDINTTVLR